MIIVNGKVVSEDGNDTTFVINTNGGNYNRNIEGDYIQGGNR